MQEVITKPKEETHSWLDRPLLTTITLNLEMVIFVVILIATVFSRLYILGERVMSHDETSHVYFSWLLNQGRGYQHDPITHGPLQFHLISLSYFLFGDNDLTARLPHALFSIATIAFAWAFRRHLGRTAALVTALLLMISPFILYYGRYARNEALVGLFGLLMLWAILRYIETGLPKYIYFLAASIVLHITAKETAYIYVAQSLLFLAGYFIYRVSKRPWGRPKFRSTFLQAVTLGLVLLGAAGFLSRLGKDGPGTGLFGLTISPGVVTVLAIVVPVLAVLSALILLAAFGLLLYGFSIHNLRNERSFDLLIVIGTLFLPLLTAFPLNFLNWTVPTSAAGVNGLILTDMIKMGSVLILMFVIAIAVGYWWKGIVWVKSFILFYAIFAVFYTTIFTNGAGLFTGLLGGLGYWLVQQGENRGSQPWYYYSLIQVPIYEYLPLLGSLLAGVLASLGFRAGGRIISGPTNGDIAAAPEGGELTEPDQIPVIEEPERPPVLSLLGFWSVSALLAYTVAGEKMPWLTFHITLPMIPLAGWAIGALIDTFDWRKFVRSNGLIIMVLIVVFFLSLGGSLSSMLGNNPPFQGKNLDQLSATSTFLIAFIAAVVSGGSLLYLISRWQAGQIARLAALIFFGLLAVLTARTSFTANFINYDNANELLVYAHAGPGIKNALNQIEEISQRTTNGLGVVVAYDDQTTYPYWWYLRNYENAKYFGKNPTRELRDAPVILAGEENYSLMDPIVRENYHSFEYIRMWWPNQEYFNLTWARISDALSNPEMREALFQIWLNRDYSLYGQLTNTVSQTTLETWSPAARMRLYVRKDVAAQLWNYGTAPAAEAVTADPYEGKGIELQADSIIGQTGSEPGQFMNPRDMAFAPDGSIYVSDTGNNRIQHITREGEVLHVWGTYGSLESGGQPEGGQFDQPWGIAVGPDGSVYVADLWNHRIQKFTSEGQFIDTWGIFGQAETLYALWGPRDIAIDDQGRLFVTDTGNKRIVVYDADGEALFDFGEQGFELGQFHEPVGLAIDSEGNLFVADTWNQRIQMLAPSEDGEDYDPVTAWDVSGWYGESLDNKPYIAVDEQGFVYVTDPEGYRVLQFNSNGEFIRYWGDIGQDSISFGLANGIAADPAGGVWLVDMTNGRLMHFPVPAE